MTDDGYTVGDLRQSGCDLESRKRRDLLTLTLNGFGVKIENEALTVHASSENFALRKHNLVQAMLAVNDLFYLAAPMVASLFLEDVTTWLNLYEIDILRGLITGQSTRSPFDFVVPASRKYPKEYCRR